MANYNYESRVAQLDRWVAGNATHDEVTGECTPDFACCNPELLAQPAMRETFRQAWLDERHEIVTPMLGEFLSAAIVHHFAKKGITAKVDIDGSVEVRAKEN